jgi:LmbE family N-acetylglucosaminyl deacetylase
MNSRTLCSASSEEFELDAVGTVLVIAPHPDDESIGCGGLIACLRRQGIKVWVMIGTDGTGSHPNSPGVPTSQLLAIRRREVLAALGILGVQRRCVFFGNLRDRLVPSRGPGFQGAVVKACSVLAKLSPGLLVIPSPSDQHGDHRALAAIWRHAANRATNALRVVEYLVWPSATPTIKAHCLKLDISSVRHLKRRAIAAHRSQRGLIVTDDPRGFILPPALLACANRPWETYFEKGV